MALVTRALVAAAVLTLFGLFLSVEAQTSPLVPVPVPTSCADKTNTSCGDCLQNVSCLWCGQDTTCIDYPVRFYLLPSSSICPWDWARWGVCWINLQNLVIVFSLVLGIIIFAVLVLICCCCCCRCQKRGGNKKQAARMERHTRMGNIGKKARGTDIKLRHDAVRSKHGLAMDDRKKENDDSHFLAFMPLATVIHTAMHTDCGIDSTCDSFT